jgi:hypothetical protein
LIQDSFAVSNIPADSRHLVSIMGQNGMRKTEQDGVLI